MKTEPMFALWPILPFGAADDSGDQDSDSDQQQQDSDKSNQPPPQGNSSKDTQKKDEDDEDDPYKGLSTKELRKLLKDSEVNRETAESARKALQDKAEEEERKKRTKEENLEKDLNAEKETNNALRVTNSKLAITNAILMDNRFEWHNPEIVAQQLDSTVVKVTDDGKVEGIAKELARVAKDHDYLLKAKGGRKQDDSKKDVTGFQPGQGGAGDSGDSTNFETLANLMPALRSRR